MIRSARHEDVPAILGLIHANNDHLLERSAGEVEALLPTFWVAEIDGEVVGCCCLEVYSRKIAEVRSLVVKDGVRRRGIGRGLVLEAVAEARRRHIAEILTVTGELDFFQSLNFHTCLNEKYALFWHDASGSDEGGNPSPESKST
ncbi:MAG: GNAT family N-acetyltransferase [Bryobacterales bacterium]|nr:GNAT family N-acetyltransferase [Bryobacterales bacterium]